MALEEHTLLHVWEQGRQRQPLDRALLLLWACGEGAAQADELAQRTIGQRDAQLLQARIRHFGPLLEATADCPACAGRMAFSLHLDQLAQQARPAAADVCVDTAAGRFRLPASVDLALALSQSEPRQALARGLRVDAGPTAAPAHVAHAAHAALDEAALQSIESALAAADPAAQIDIRLQCDACGQAFDAPLDVADCLWLDVSRRAQQTLDEVHLLASAYGWSEAEVLAVPPARRQHYLQRVLS